MGALLKAKQDEPQHQRSNAYEVALVNDNIDNSYFIMDDENLDDLTIDEPEPLVLRIDLGGGNFANITAYKNSNPE